MPRTSPASLGDAFALSLGLNQTATSPASIGDAFALGFGLPRTSPASLGDAFALSFGLPRTSPASLGDAFALSIGLPRTSPASLGDAFALSIGLPRTSPASLGDAFALSIGLPRTSPASLGDAFALSLGLNQPATSPASLGDAFGLGFGLPRTSPASLGDAFALSLGLNQPATSPATLGDAFALGFGLPRTSPASLGDAFALSLGLNQPATSPATLSDAFGLGFGLPRTSPAALGDAFALSLGLNQVATSPASIGDAFGLGFGLPRTSPAALGDAFALSLGVNRAETSPASLGDAFGLGFGFPRSSPASLADAFALSLGLNRAATSSAIVSDSFGLGLGVNGTKTSSATLTHFVVFTIQRNFVSLTPRPPAPTKEDATDNRAYKSEKQSATIDVNIEASQQDIDDLRNALATVLGCEVEFVDLEIQIVSAENRLVTSLGINGMCENKQISGELNIAIGNLSLQSVDGRGTASIALDRGLSVKGISTLRLTNHGIEIVMTNLRLVFEPDAPNIRNLRGGSNSVTQVGAKFDVELARMPTGASLSAQFARIASAFIGNSEAILQLGAEELGLQLRHPRNDIAFAIEVTGNGLTNEDLGDSIVTMSVSTNWYVKRLQEGKQIAIAKIENTRRVFSSLANCTELGETVECRAEFAGESRGFSVFTLVALSKAPMPTATSTPGWPSFTPTATELSYPGQPDVIPAPSGLLFSPDTTSTPISQPSPISMSPTPTPVAIATSEAPIPGLEPTPTALVRENSIDVEEVVPSPTTHPLPTPTVDANISVRNMPTPARIPAESMVSEQQEGLNIPVIIGILLVAGVVGMAAIVILLRQLRRKLETYKSKGASE